MVPAKYHTVTQKMPADEDVTTKEQAAIARNISSQYETVLWSPVSPEHIRAGTEVHLFVPANNLKNVLDDLQTHNLKYIVLLDNTNELIEMQTRNDSSDPRSSTSYYERYHSLEDIYFWIHKMAQDYPDMIKVLLIGSSFEKNPLYVLKLSGRQERAEKRAMWIDCGIHAREWISPAFCLWFVQYSVSFYTQNNEIKEILDSMDIYVLPVMNPDGYQYTWTTNRMWRKNRSVRQDSNCIGTDLNRNFDANWCTKGASPRPCEEIYCGQYPESEPEAVVVANFLRSHKDVLKLYLSIHSYGQMLLFPYACSNEHVPNHADLLQLVEEAAMKIKKHYRNIYKYGASAETIYLAPGGSDDWAYNLGILYSFTFELEDRGRYGFLLPPSLISKACNEALLAVKSVALRVIQKTQAGLQPEGADCSKP
ncbi:hypothetical protein DPEC_G00156270 [Dallia pectoralis]|uniref:Uncharacterized protein n=1 Tax=Dallia pectoralis TaxID=75939 RepID=A0ACC2GKP8_DALPE|nr:hypothetical protein DPEC_G00156270 [Dallia pectoralis]